MRNFIGFVLIIGLLILAIWVLQLEPKGNIFQIGKNKDKSQVLPLFKGKVSNITNDEINIMKQYSWYEGCPVLITDLRRLDVSYYGFDHQSHVGEIIVNKSVAENVLYVFKTLYHDKFPIEKMLTIDKYSGSDEASIADDNTSGFNCRKAGNTNIYSQHAYGMAVDINPKINPYVEKSKPLPLYGDRPENTEGMIYADSIVVEAFKNIGWGWGGDWKVNKDYQHFSANGK